MNDRRFDISLPRIRCARVVMFVSFGVAFLIRTIDRRIAAAALAVGVFAGTFAAYLAKRNRRMTRTRRRLGQCLACGYDLTGNVSGRCPECGHWRT